MGNPPHCGRQARNGAGRATGPRSDAGRRRAAQNARKHGLTASGPEPQAIAEVLSLLAATPGISALPPDLCLRLAEAEARRRQAQQHQRQIEARLDALLASTLATQALADGATALWTALRLALRYRAEAEAGRRGALRDLLAALAGDRP